MPFSVLDSAGNHKTTIGSTKLDELDPPTDVTTLNASSSAHGLMPKLDNNVNHFFTGTGTQIQVPLASGVSGTLADGSLSSNVPLKNGTNAFTGANSFATNPLDLLVGQLKFPATQNASADANTLDDYEEGSWTPVIGGATSESGQTYSSQIGKYIKIGPLVVATCLVQLSAKGTITGAVQLKGLPFVAAEYSSTSDIRYNTFATAFMTVLGNVLQSQSVVGLYAEVANTTSISALLAAADLTNTSRIIATFTYPT